LALALALAASVPLAAQQEGRGETIPLRFGWEPGMRAEIDFEQVRLLRIGSERDSVRLAATYRMDVSAHEAGLAVEYSDLRWTALPPPRPGTGRFYEALVRVALGARPPSVVSRTGEFLRVEGAEQVAAQTGQALQPLLAGVRASLRESAQAIIAAGLQPGALRGAADAEWNRIVGMWAGQELVIGLPYTSEISSELPVLEGVAIPIHLKMRVVERIRCTPEDAEQRCVEMEVTSAPDQGAMTQAFTDFLARTGLPDEQVQAMFAQFNIQSSYRLHTDPRTLRPYYLQGVSTTTADPGAEESSQVETRTFRFRYPP
ncbi:MAG TPA: hypothetical protein VLK84_24850, partial [Longimicrobium sp.]|nr:hypothetical protein [Longimicrobium sp.]